LWLECGEFSEPAEFARIVKVIEDAHRQSL
jgi:hypothetical protein